MVMPPSNRWCCCPANLIVVVVVCSGTTTAERIGALNIVCRDAATADAVKSQLKTIIRPMYSNPPLHGARLVSKILSDKSLYDEWYRACVRVCMCMRN